MRKFHLLPLITLAVAALLLFHRLGTHGLGKYDEARRGVNAIEMLHGESSLLVPTYADRPDRWGTKPPLLVWTQALSMKAFGMDRFAVRLPSAVATLLLVGLLLLWSRRVWGSYLGGTVAAAYVLGSAEFMSTHGARTGDFDALLTLFLTAQLYFIAAYAGGRRRRDLWLFALSITLAGWTKGVAGCFFLPGIGIWLLFTPDGRRVLGQRHVYLAGALGLGGILLYYGLRETVDPGYIQQVWENELGGRFAEVNEGHGGAWYYYLDALFYDEGSHWQNFLLIPAAATLLGRRMRTAGLVACVTATFLLVISVASTKLFWYKGPALPLIGLLLGGAAVEWFRLCRRGAQRRPEGVFLLGMLALTSAYALFITARQAHLHLPLRNFTAEEAPYRATFGPNGNPPPFTLIAHGYQPVARFYLTRAQVQGDSVEIGYSRAPPMNVTGSWMPPVPLIPDERVVVCHVYDWNYVYGGWEFHEIGQQGRCKLLVIQGPRVDSTSAN